MVGTFHDQCYDETMGDDWLDGYVNPILDAKYDNVTIDQVVDQQVHLSHSQKQDLYKVLNKYEKLFDGTLGVYPHKKFHIDIDKDAKPVHARHYPVPMIHSETLRKELKHLVDIGVLAPQSCDSVLSK